jgi:hypothetical protein
VPVPTHLQPKHLFIEHLAQKLVRLEGSMSGRAAIVYRVHAGVLRNALAGYPEALLRRTLGRVYPPVRHALDNRAFEALGHFADAPAARSLADECIARWRGAPRASSARDTSASSEA